MELISHIKESVILAQEKRRFSKTLQESGIRQAGNLGVREIGEERQNALVAWVLEEEFLKFVTSKKPKEIPYRMVNTRNEFIAAEFYAKLRGRTFIRTTGLLEDDSGAETLLSRLYVLSYIINQHHTYEQPWGRMTHLL